MQVAGTPSATRAGVEGGDMYRDDAASWYRDANTTRKRAPRTSANPRFTCTFKEPRYINLP